MKTTYSTIAAIGVVTLTLAGSAAAQDRSALLTSIEINRLVTDGRSADHAQLRDHFNALADTYAKKAERASAVVLTFGNPNHAVAVPAGGYPAERVKRARETAATLRALAAYHAERAAGRLATLPAGAESFERGQGAPEPTAAQVRELVASARSVADHQALEAYFARQADRETTRAEWHSAVALMNRVQTDDRGNVRVALALHCEHEAAVAGAAAREARAAAERQRRAGERG